MTPCSFTFAKQTLQSLLNKHQMTSCALQGAMLYILRYLIGVMKVSTKVEGHNIASAWEMKPNPDEVIEVNDNDTEDM